MIKQQQQRRRRGGAGEEEVMVVVVVAAVAAEEEAQEEKGRGSSAGSGTGERWVKSDERVVDEIELPSSDVVSGVSAFSLSAFISFCTSSTSCGSSPSYRTTSFSSLSSLSFLASPSSLSSPIPLFSLRGVRSPGDKTSFFLSVNTNQEEERPVRSTLFPHGEVGEPDPESETVSVSDASSLRV